MCGDPPPVVRERVLPPGLGSASGSLGQYLAADVPRLCERIGGLNVLFADENAIRLLGIAVTRRLTHVDINLLGRVRYVHSRVVVNGVIPHASRSTQRNVRWAWQANVGCRGWHSISRGIHTGYVLRRYRWSARALTAPR